MPDQSIQTEQDSFTPVADPGAEASQWQQQIAALQAQVDTIQQTLAALKTQAAPEVEATTTLPKEVQSALETDTEVTRPKEQSLYAGKLNLDAAVRYATEHNLSLEQAVLDMRAEGKKLEDERIAKEKTAQEEAERKVVEQQAQPVSPVIDTVQSQTETAQPSHTAPVDLLKEHEQENGLHFPPNERDGILRIIQDARKEGRYISADDAIKQWGPSIETMQAAHTAANPQEPVTQPVTSNTFTPSLTRQPSQPPQLEQNTNPFTFILPKAQETPSPFILQQVEPSRNPQNRAGAGLWNPFAGLLRGKK